MPKFTTFLWFENDAEEAARFYVSVFPRAKVLSSNAMSVTFELEGQVYTAFNGGPHYELTPAASIFVSCETQEEVDTYWNKLLADGGKEQPCGWLVDRFGLSWQVIPTILGKLLFHQDKEKAQRAMNAMMRMKKIDIAQLVEAAGNP